MLNYQLQDEDLAGLSGLVDELAARYQTVETAQFQREAYLYAAELPRGLRRAVGEFRARESSAALVLSGVPVADEELGPTPSERGAKPVPSPSLRQDLAFYLISCLLGDPIGWATQQDGYLLHDVYPVRGHEHEQIGWGSEEVLTWHTEDAFHPLRTDYLALMCLRNPDKVETTLADISEVEIDAELREQLWQERFRIVPDNAHRAKLAAEVVEEPRVAELRRRSQEQVERLAADPEPVAVLFGDPESPYVRIDPFYMENVQGPEEQAALDRVIAAIDAAMTGVSLSPGEIIFIDNYRAVHGRKAFRARFDGTDRWLRRLNVTRDLRKSRALRENAESRVIY